MSIENTNLAPPNFAPALPTYPQLDQLLLVTGGSVGTTGDGKRIYPAVASQVDPAVLVTRQREACYVFEANNIQLNQLIYDCRLVGSYLGLPLYATGCCS